MWDKIKHALNSTLGTPDFKPLNEIIMQEKDLAASDYVYKVVRSSGSASMYDDFSLTANRNGSIRILVYVGKALDNLGTRISVQAFKNSVNIGSNSKYYGKEDPAETLTLDVNITKGDVITIKISDGYANRRPVVGVAIGAVELDVTGISIN